MLVLEEIFKSKKCEYTAAFNLRIQRALSWLKKAGQLDSDLDLKFSCLWVSFNAICAQNFVIAQDQPEFRQFLYNLYQADSERRIDYKIWEKMCQPIQRLLENPYIFQQFWDYKNHKISQSLWIDTFNSAKEEVDVCLQNKDTLAILALIFNRLNTLSNQFIHGGVTYNSSINRKQMQHGCQILSGLISAFIFILLENAPILDSGQPFYPVVQMC